MNIINRSPYLRTSREYPEDNVSQLVQEINKSYLDIATAVNDRTIGIFPVNRPAITGESWFITGNRRQQTLRQVYTITNAIYSSGSILHGINILGISQMSPFCYGSYLDTSGNYNGFIYGSSSATSIPGQISFYITPNSAGNVLDGTIVFVTDGAAPTFSSGTIVLQWIANI